jgi:KDO2-lipid IV(A) lauroyltransferase
LPFFILHLLSDLIFLLVYYVIGYRKEVVVNNLKLAFPEKKEKELQKIHKKFFKHFIDIFIEMAKSFTISEKELNKRYKYLNPEVLKEAEALNKSIILMGSHYGNWEWIINFPKVASFKTIAAYTRLTNPHYDNLIRKNRNRFGGEFIQSSKTIKKILENKQKNILSVYGLLSDQSPSIHKTHYWAPFLNVKVPIHTGAEMLAKKHDFTVLYMSVTKTKRSHYEVSFKILSKNPKEAPDYTITDQFLALTEKQIRKQPEYYFWTHKRFKHKDNAPVKHTTVKDTYNKKN